CHDLSMATLDRIAPASPPPVPLSGSLRATADLKGELSPLAVHASGTAAAKDLRVEDVRVAVLDFNWDTDPQRLRLTQVRGNLYQGKLTGDADLPLSADLPGKFNFRVADLDTAALSRDIPAMPARLQGQAHDTVQGTLAPAGQNQARLVNAKV